jgi:hypothetical protein
MQGSGGVKNETLLLLGVCARCLQVENNYFYFFSKIEAKHIIIAVTHKLKISDCFETKMVSYPFTPFYFEANMDGLT